MSTCLHVYMHSRPVHKSLRGSFLLTTYTLWFHHKPQSSYAKSKNQRLCLHDINSVWRITAGDESWLSFFESGSRGHAWKQRPCSSFNIQESWTVNWSLRLKLSTRKEEEKLCLAVGRGLSSLKPIPFFLNVAIYLLTKINQTIPLKHWYFLANWRSTLGGNLLCIFFDSQITSAADFNLFFRQEAEIGDISFVPLWHFLCMCWWVWQAAEEERRCTCAEEMPS